MDGTKGSERPSLLQRVQFGLGILGIGMVGAQFFEKYGVALPDKLLGLGNVIFLLQCNTDPPIAASHIWMLQP